MFDITSIVNIIPFIFLLSASILTNFIGDIMGCKIQKLFSNNIFLKYLVILFIIYSTISVFENKTSPKEHFIKSLYILILFILFTKNTLRITLFIGACMVILFIIEDYKNYYKNIKKNKTVEELNKIATFFKTIILIFIIYGHIIYIIKQKNKFSTNFDIIKLYKGDKCIII